MASVSVENIGKYNSLKTELAEVKSKLQWWYKLSENPTVKVFYMEAEYSKGMLDPWFSGSSGDRCHSCGSVNNDQPWHHTGLTVDALKLTAKPIQQCKDIIARVEREIAKIANE